MKPANSIGPALFDHIGLATRDLETPMRFFCGVLGGKPYAGGPSRGFFGAQWEFAEGGRLEAIVPDGAPGGFLRRFLDRHGPGVHHVTFKVADIHAAAAAAGAHGYEVVGLDDSNPGWKQAFLHPRQAQGIVVQFAESRPELDADWGAEFRFPPSPGEGPDSPARVRGLLVSASDEASARRLWGDLAGGGCQPEAGGFRFNWPDCPLGVYVRVDPSRAPGPLAVQVDLPPDCVLEDRPVAGLGVRFVAEGGGSGA